MSSKTIIDLVTSSAVASDHAFATTTRNGKIEGFAASTDRGRATSGDVGANGEIFGTAFGSSPQGEDGTMAACERFVAHLNRNGGKWSEPTEVANTRDIDATVSALEDSDCRIIKIQVVRANIDETFWRELNRNGKANISDSVSGIARKLKAAIELKTRKLNSDKRSELTLLLDAGDVPALSLDSVIDEFNDKHSEWLKAQGFESIWVVGPCEEMVRQLAPDNQHT